MPLRTSLKNLPVYLSTVCKWQYCLPLWGTNTMDNLMKPLVFRFVNKRQITLLNTRLIAILCCSPRVANGRKRRSNIDCCRLTRSFRRWARCRTEAWIDRFLWTILNLVAIRKGSGSRFSLFLSFFGIGSSEPLELCSDWRDSLCINVGYEKLWMPRLSMTLLHKCAVGECDWRHTTLCCSRRTYNEMKCITLSNTRQNCIEIFSRHNLLKTNHQYYPRLLCILSPRLYPWPKCLFLWILGLDFCMKWKIAVPCWWFSAWIILSNVCTLPWSLFFDRWCAALWYRVFMDGAVHRFQMACVWTVDFCFCCCLLFVFVFIDFCPVASRVLVHCWLRLWCLNDTSHVMNAVHFGSSCLRWVFVQCNYDHLHFCCCFFPLVRWIPYSWRANKVPFSDVMSEYCSHLDIGG